MNKESLFASKMKEAEEAATASKEKDYTGTAPAAAAAS